MIACPDCNAALRGDGSCCDTCSWTWHGGGDDPRLPSGRSREEVHQAILRREDDDLNYALHQARARDVAPHQRVALLLHAERLARQHLVNATRRWRDARSHAASTPADLAKRARQTSDDLEHRFLVLDSLNVEISTARAAAEVAPSPARFLDDEDLARIASKIAPRFDAEHRRSVAHLKQLLLQLAEEAAMEGRAVGSVPLRVEWEGDELIVDFVLERHTLRIERLEERASARSVTP